MAALLPILLLIVLMYFMLIRPQQKRMRAQQALLSAVVEGDEILTTAGMYGFVTAMDGDVVWVEIAEGVEVRVAKGAIARRVEPTQEASGEATDKADVHTDDSPDAKHDAGTGPGDGDAATHQADDES